MFIGLCLAILAAGIHVYIFYLESIAWLTPRARTAFGFSETEAEATKFIAFNMGFYNVFLAIIVGLGVTLAMLDHRTVGGTLVLAGAGAMAAASLVLMVSSPTKFVTALKQGVVPAMAVVCVGLALP